MELNKRIDIGVIAHRGSGKSTIEYFIELEKMRLSEAISYKEYVIMKAVALNILYGVSKEEVLAWLDKKLEDE